MHDPPPCLCRGLVYIHVHVYAIFWGINCHFMRVGPHVCGLGVWFHESCTKYLLAEGPFINHGAVAKLLEDRGRDPGLKDQPATYVDASDGLRAKRGCMAAVERGCY